MDIPRKDFARKRRLRRVIYTAAAVVVTGAFTYGLSRLEPAAPGIEAATVFAGEVERGDMILDVRGLGTLVPEDILLVPARDEGRVERRRLLPGSPVEPRTILVDLSNPQLEQDVFDTESEIKAAEAELADLRVQLKTETLNLKATAAQVESDYQVAKADYEAQTQLAAAGITDQVSLMKARITAEQLEIRVGIEKERMRMRAGAVEAQVTARQVRLDQQRRLLALRKQKLERLQIRAGIHGVLQQLEVQVGELVSAGTVIARVSDPRRLKAELKIAETQAKDILLGQRAEIDTRNGIIQGSVMRVDPAVIEGTVTIDVRLEDELPKGARPDLSVDGRIVLDHLKDVLKVGRPVYAQAGNTISLFRIEPDGIHASRLRVEVGRVSVNEIQIRGGLRAGDKVILSDMSAMDSFDRIRLE